MKQTELPMRADFKYPAPYDNGVRLKPFCPDMGVIQYPFKSQYCSCGADNISLLGAQDRGVPLSGVYSYVGEGAKFRIV